MKLIVQSDDYGITRGVSQGILSGIRYGIIRNTGIFTNMPWTEECAEWIRPELDRIALGIDLNASTGSSVLGHSVLPSLTHEDGSFLTSRENRALDTQENGFDHVSYDEVYLEFEAQIQKFIDVMGRLPDYIHRHAYFTKTTDRVINDLARKYGLPDSDTVMHLEGMKLAASEWYRVGTADEQLKTDLTSYILEDRAHLLDSEFGFLCGHAGYADTEIIALSSFNILRIKDLEGFCNPKVLQWVNDNQIELITYRDLNKYFSHVN